MIGNGRKIFHVHKSDIIIFSKLTYYVLGSKIQTVQAMDLIKLYSEQR